jgi:hypothetical protein
VVLFVLGYIFIIRRKKYSAVKGENGKQEKEEAFFLDCSADVAKLSRIFQKTVFFLKLLFTGLFPAPLACA